MLPQNNLLAKLDNKNGNAKVYDKELVRTDSREQKIERFLSTTVESMPSLSQSFINPTHSESASVTFEESITTNSTRKDARQISELVKPIQKEPEQIIATNHSSLNAGTRLVLYSIPIYGTYFLILL